MKIRNKIQLIESSNQGNRIKYILFWGHQKPKSGVSKSCFSQWYESPFYEGNNLFMTAEHSMMYQKAKLFGDGDAAKRLLTAENPGKAKAIGREIVGFEEDVWIENRFKIVVNSNMAKFRSNPELKEYLLSTGDRVLVEASPIDKIWGIGLSTDDPFAEVPEEWPGENLLGFALMEVRSQLNV